MTKPVPLALLVVLFVAIALNVPSALMWFFATIMVIALVVLIFVMKTKGMFVGPETLADDLRQTTKDLLKDRGGETERVEEQRIRREIEEELEDVDPSDSNLKDTRR